MAFERLGPSLRILPQYVGRSTNMNFTKSAWEALGKPEWVILKVHRATKRIQVIKVPEKGPERRRHVYESSKTSYRISGVTRWARHYDLPSGIYYMIKPGIFAQLEVENEQTN